MYDISGQEELPLVEPTIKYLLHDPTGKATDELHKRWRFQIKSKAERQDSLVETFGKRRHGMELSRMGFELLEIEEGRGFSGTGYHSPAQLHRAF